LINQSIRISKIFVLILILMTGSVSGQDVMNGRVEYPYRHILDSTDTGKIPIIVETESGELGNYFAIQADGEITFVTTTMNHTGTSPEDTNRVATYEIEFADYGDYNLFARVKVGPGQFDDDSFFYGSDFGVRNVTLGGDWNLVNGLGAAGFSDVSDFVDGPGSVGTEIWKWINITKNAYQSSAGSPFHVDVDSLSRTFQIATREDGLAIDKFAFGRSDLFYTVNDLDNMLPGSDSMGDPTDPTDPIDPIYKDSVYVNQEPAVIDLVTTHQKIAGFGAASPWYLPVATDSEIESAFGMDDGEIGFSIYRITVEADSSLWSKWVPATKQALDMGAKIIASPWYAPDDITEFRNNETRIQLDKYGDYIDHLNAFITFMQNNGVKIYGLSVQNEPDIGDWTNWSPDEMLTLMRDYAHGLQGTKVMAPESYHFNRSYSDPILNEITAVANTDIICGHIYGGGLTKYPLAEEKGKEVWMTEYLMGDNNSGNNIDWAMALAENINDVMLADMNAYVWWTMIRYYGPIGDGSSATNPADPLEPYPAKGEVTKKGYVMSQFSKFIRPGYYRISSQDIPHENVSATAYRDSASSEIVFVAINTAPYSITQTFTIQNGSVERFTPFVTSPYKNCEESGEVVVANDSLEVTLEGYSVTTFVSSGPVDIVNNVEEQNVKPASFKLYQNYPNPFNPSTVISYQLPVRSRISLKIYNMLGQEVATLFEGTMHAGYHQVTFNGSRFASGIYFYRIRGESFVDIKKMFLIK
jgi:glucuronoarabinoxylan endo-1,4-beta-xylanase